jgi:hypothetical protein
MERVITNYDKSRQADLFSFATIVLKQMDGNPNFPSPVPTHADFTTTVTGYGQRLTNAGDRSRTAIAEKNVARLAVLSGLHSWGLYVNMMSEGNVDKLASSGLREAKQREPIHLTAPVITSIMQGLNPGELLISVKKPRGAQTLNYMIAKDPITATTEWLVFGDSRSKFLYTELEQGAKYWMKVVAIGSNNQAVESEEVAQYVMQRTLAKAA